MVRQPSLIVCFEELVAVVVGTAVSVPRNRYCEDHFRNTLTSERFCFFISSSLKKEYCHFVSILLF